MTKFTLLRLKNEMLLTNVIANAFGVVTVIFLTYQSAYQGSEEALRLASRFGFIFDAFWIILILFLILLYERPMRRFLDGTYRQLKISSEITLKARQRLLNEPFFLTALDMSVWIIAAVLYALVLWISDVPQPAVYVSFAQCLLTGLITSVTAFFLLRSTLQRRLAPVFFPSGGLFLTPSTLRIRISVRIAALVSACNFVPFLILIVLVLATYQADLEASLILDHLRSNIFINSLIFMVAGVLLMILVSFNLRQPFQNIIRVLQSVRNGDFNHKVRVTSNDEIGYTGDMVNEMTEGLKERDRLRHSLELAEEVQQHFLPRANPQVTGLDIAGQSRFCDQTGGDYYDYIETPTPDAGKIGVVIGDVSGHGIPSALLMASARSSLRQRVSMGGDIGLVIADVNRQIARDVEDSGRFMTLFYTEIDTSQRSIRWVRAGHEPAIFYDPRQDLLEELKGEGMALGVDENWTYTQYHKTGLERGQIIVLATDGIWEAHNARGEMFGKDDFHKTIRLHADKGANQILTAVYTELEEFQRGVEPEDDVTLVIIKIDS